MPKVRNFPNRVLLRCRSECGHEFKASQLPFGLFPTAVIRDSNPGSNTRRVAVRLGWIVFNFHRGDLGLNPRVDRRCTITAATPTTEEETMNDAVLKSIVLSLTAACTSVAFARSGEVGIT